MVWDGREHRQDQTAKHQDEAARNEDTETKQLNV